MQWLKATLHFPSFFSYRIPGYSSQYALSVPLPSPSSLKLALVATAIRIKGNVSEGERVFQMIKDADVRIVPPKQIAMNSYLIKRLKKKKNEHGLIPTFGIKEFVFFPEDIDVFIGLDHANEILKYLKLLRYVGSSDSLVYVKCIDNLDDPPVNVVKAIKSDEFAKIVKEHSYLVYPVKDIGEKATFEQINPYSSSKSNRETLDQKYYLINAKVRKGKNWKIIDIQN